MLHEKHSKEGHDWTALYALTVIETALLMKLYVIGCVMAGNVGVIVDRKFGRAEMTRRAMVY